MHPRLDYRQVRAAAAMLHMDAVQLAAAVGRHHETMWKLMAGKTKNGTASPSLSADLVAYFESRGVTFAIQGRSIGAFLDTEHEQPETETP